MNIRIVVSFSCGINLILRNSHLLFYRNHTLFIKIETLFLVEKMFRHTKKKHIIVKLASLRIKINENNKCERNNFNHS